MLKLARSLLLAGGLVGVMAGAVQADEAAIVYRQSVYKAIGGHTEALALILKGEVDHPQDAVPHAKALGALGPMVEHVFPEGSGTGKTRALPSIWEQPEKFAKARSAFMAAAVALGKAADENPKDIAAAFGAMVKTCKVCHDDFRKKLE